MIVYEKSAVVVKHIYGYTARLSQKRLTILFLLASGNNVTLTMKLLPTSQPNIESMNVLELYLKNTIMGVDYHDNPTITTTEIEMLLCAHGCFFDTLAEEDDDV